MVFKGAEMVIESLRKEKVDTIFAYPGGAVIPIFDVLFDADDINVVLTRHEQAAVHAADAYARTTGKTGVCIVTSGPGATNTVTGLATANFDSVPLVCISGQVPRNMIGNDAFQEADTVGITRPVTKHNYIVTKRENLGKTLREAFHIASTGRPGPVVVDIPKDILYQPLEETYPEDVNLQGYTSPGKGHAGQLKRAVTAVNDAKKPLFFAGGGINVGDSSKIFRNIIEKTGIPVVTSLMGIGALETKNPLNLGMIGMHGTYAANLAVSECDLLFGIGVRFDDRVTMNLEKFAPLAKIIHLDIDPSAIARNVPVEIPIVGDAKIVLEELYPLLDKKDRPAWHKTIKEWKDEAICINAYEGFNAKEDDSSYLMPYQVISTVNRTFPDAIVTTEVGQNQMWTALFWNFKEPRTLITSGGLGTMGYGFPAAIGAAIACKDRRVVAIAGDGSFQMNLQELATAVKCRLPIVIVILNNGYLGMVRQWQQMFNGGRYSSTHLNDRIKADKEDKVSPDGSPDFVKLADAYGAEGCRVRSKSELEDALKKAAALTDVPIIIDCLIEPEANVWPMVSPGAGLDEMVFCIEKEEE
ncbi:MAG: biosynthetic-type acetolactate synthase large subunit [Spirochaetales bacterium]|nr:biosynthetic-type acetolactate synthase large subunit [Spirochaetales bacterium]